VPEKGSKVIAASPTASQPDPTGTMGSPESEAGRLDGEGPQHEVTIAKPFAVSKFEVT
jgi:formylglycine-generating enzyme required for sulfatase activity